MAQPDTQHVAPQVSLQPAFQSRHELTLPYQFLDPDDDDTDSVLDTVSALQYPVERQ